MEYGYINYFNIDCIYSISGNTMDIIAKDDGDIQNLLEHLYDKNYTIQYSSPIYKQSYAHVLQGYYRTVNALQLNLDYRLETVPNEGYIGMDIKGDEIDMFFNPANYYYFKREKSKNNHVDLNYNIEKIDDFEFTLADKKIFITLNYGNILSDGIASDMKLHPILYVRFERTKDIIFINSVYLTIIRFIKLVMHKKTVNLQVPRVIGICNGIQSHVGDIFYKPYSKDNSYYDSNIEYNFFKPYINKLLQLVADDSDGLITHFPELNESRFDYDVLRFLKVFIAFESECSKRKVRYENANDSSVKVIKKDAVNAMKLLRTDATDNEEKDFVDQAIDKITKIGTEYGQNKKIQNAYEVLSTCLCSSMNQIFWTNKNSNIENSEIVKETAKALASTRGKIAHGSFTGELTDADMTNIRFLDILVYAQILKRAGVDDNQIELILGCEFLCNSIFINFKH